MCACVRVRVCVCDMRLAAGPTLKYAPIRVPVAQALSEEFGMFKFSATDNITYQLDEASTTPLPKYTFLGRCELGRHA